MWQWWYLWHCCRRLGVLRILLALLLLGCLFMLYTTFLLNANCQLFAVCWNYPLLFYLHKKSTSSSRRWCPQLLAILCSFRSDFSWIASFKLATNGKSEFETKVVLWKLFLPSFTSLWRFVQRLRTASFIRDVWLYCVTNIQVTKNCHYASFFDIFLFELYFSSLLKCESEQQFDVYLA